MVLRTLLATACKQLEQLQGQQAGDQEQRPCDQADGSRFSRWCLTTVGGRAGMLGHVMSSCMLPVLQAELAWAAAGAIASIAGGCSGSAGR
jgi:hypothetical protein